MARDGYEMADVTTLTSGPQFVVARLPPPKRFEPISFGQFDMLSLHDQEAYIRRARLHMETGI
ncbi:hypothetical protein J7E62_27715 [Variovorax paradoxus]|nr:hypothetical protein [Variovorax paradoxus]